jgi:hypothetical protein
MDLMRGDDLPADYWRDLIAHLPATVLIIDHAGKIKYINNTVAPLKFEDVIGRTIYDYISEEEKCIARDAIQ